jgi:hypothetical protein
MKGGPFINALVDSIPNDEDDKEDWLSWIVASESDESAVDKFFSELK